MHVRFTVALLADGKLGKPQQVWLRELSRSGLSFLAPAPMRPGELFVAILPAKRHGGRAPVCCMKCRVVQHYGLGDNAFMVGAAFIATVPAAIADTAAGSQ